MKLGVRFSSSFLFLASVTGAACVTGGGLLEARAETRDTSDAPGSEDAQLEAVKKLYHDFAEVERKFLAANKSDTLAQLNDLRKFNHVEVQDLILRRLEQELVRFSQTKSNPNSTLDLLEALVRALIPTGQDDFKKRIRSAIGVGKTLFEGQPEEDEWNETVRPNLEHLLKNPEKSGGALRSLMGEALDISVNIDLKGRFGAESGALQEKVLKHMAPFRQMLASRLIGQPEVIQAFYDLEFQTRLYDFKRENAEVVLLMGLKGSGQDTAVEAFTDALHLRNGSFQKHRFKLGPIRRPEELWSVLGSPTGYKGSGKVPPFLRTLVEHSGGRYEIIEEPGTVKGETEEFIVEVKPDTKKKGSQNPLEFTPSRLVIQLDDFQDWDQHVKDLLIKPALARGEFTVNNPGKGVSRIQVPVTFVITTKDGTGLIASRDSFGQRVGKPMTYEQLLERWKVNSRDPEALKTELKRSHRVPSRGNSEDLVSQIPDHRLILMRPLSPEASRMIAAQSLKRMADRMQRARPVLGEIHYVFTPMLFDYLHRFDDNPEEGGRAIEFRVKNLIETSLLRAIEKGMIQSYRKERQLTLDVAENPDGTARLVVTEERDEGVMRYDLDMPGSEVRKHIEPLSVEQLQKLSTIGERIGRHVFGIQPILERLASAILVMEESQHGKTARSESKSASRTFVFLGLSSTGKTETPKAIARELFGSEDALVTLDFSSIKTYSELQAAIYGSRDENGRVVESEFMKQYDRLQGKGLFLLDEVANCSRELLKTLYPLLREKEVNGFADGKPRSMEHIKFVMTGNASEEWYQGIPREILAHEQLAALQSVYEKALGNPDFTRRFLERFFSEGFLNRVGEQNIFFFPPFNFRSVRELAQLKLEQYLKTLLPTPGHWGWRVVAKDKAAYEGLLHLIEEEGFVVREQGASIDRFVRLELVERLKAMLLKKAVPIGSQVVLNPILPSSGSPSDSQQAIEVEVTTVGETFRIAIPARKKINTLEGSKALQIQVAYHEAAHEVVRTVLFGSEAFEPLGITIIPGVDEIESEFIRFEGLARHKQVKDLQRGRDFVIRSIARLLAGNEAQKLVTRGGTSDSGKQSDIQRATARAYQAILVDGLSSSWGDSSMPSGVSLIDWISTLSESRRGELEREVKRMLEEGAALAREALLSNLDNLLIPLANELAEKGEMTGDDLKAFYAKHPVRSLARRYSVRALMARVSRWFPLSGLEPVLIPGIPEPKSIANIEEILKERREKALEGVALPEKASIASPDQALDQAKDAHLGHLAASAICVNALR